MTRRRRQTDEPIVAHPHHDLVQIANGVKLMLTGLGIDWKNDDNFRETPLRVARLFHEMLTPEPNNWKTFPARSSDMIVMRGHKVIALCPHHLQPVELTCYVGYIPNKKTVGLSKLARAVEQHLWMPMVQEDLTHAVADSLERELEPKGCGVVLTGIHGCMRFRGVESDGDTVTDSMRGVFLLNPSARSEFLHIIGRP